MEFPAAIAAAQAFCNSSGVNDCVAAHGNFNNSFARRRDKESLTGSSVYVIGFCCLELEYVVLAFEDILFARFCDLIAASLDAISHSACAALAYAVCLFCSIVERAGAYLLAISAWTAAA